MGCEDNWKPEVWFRVLVDLACAHSIPRHWPALCGLPSYLSINTRGPWPANHHLKSCHRNQTRNFGARHSVEYDVLSQQSISGKIVSLIVIVSVEAGFFQIRLHTSFCNNGGCTVIRYSQDFCIIYHKWLNNNYYVIILEWMIAARSYRS